LGHKHLHWAENSSKGQAPVLRVHVVSVKTYTCGESPLRGEASESKGGGKHSIRKAMVQSGTKKTKLDSAAQLKKGLAKKKKTNITQKQKKRGKVKHKLS